MMALAGKTKKRGFTLLEALIVGSLMSILSIVILQSILMTRKSLYISQSHVSASNLINQQVETIRGMKYENIGIRSSDNAVYVNSYAVSNDTYKASEDYLMGGQVVLGDGGSTRSDDDVVGTMVVTGFAVDDPFDKIGANDEDGDADDYYKVEVTLTWDYLGRTITRSTETYVYGLMDAGIPLDLEGDNPADHTPPDAGTSPDDTPTSGDVGVVEITTAEFDHKYDAKKDKYKNKIKVEARTGESGSPTLTLRFYGTMKYDSKKDIYKYERDGETDPGASVTVSSSAGGSATRTVTHKNQ